MKTLAFTLIGLLYASNILAQIVPHGPPAQMLDELQEQAIEIYRIKTGASRASFQVKTEPTSPMAGFAVCCTAQRLLTISDSATDKLITQFTVEVQYSYGVESKAECTGCRGAIRETVRLPRLSSPESCKYSAEGLAKKIFGELVETTLGTRNYENRAGNEVYYYEVFKDLEAIKILGLAADTCGFVSLSDIEP